MRTLCLWLASLLVYFAKPIFADIYDDRCAELVGSCEYYSCIEQNRLSCGLQGYALGYGKKYCETFSAIDFPESRSQFEMEVFPADANQWRNGVRRCLQQTLEAYFATDLLKSCQQIRTFAFNSHPDCYTQSPSFCEIPPENVLRVGLTISPSDLLTRESARQVRDTARICIEQIDWRLETETKAAVRWTLQEYQKVWRILAIEPKRFKDLLEDWQQKHPPASPQ